VPTKTLVAYITAGGVSRRYAEAVAETLRSDGMTVDLIDLKRDSVSDLEPYENVVVCAGVRMGMVYRAGKRLLGRKEMVGKRVAVLLASGIAIGDRAKAREKFLTPLMAKLGLSPVAYDAFPGSMPGAAGKTDDKVDLELARQWTREFAGRLTAA